MSQFKPCRNQSIGLQVMMIRSWANLASRLTLLCLGFAMKCELRPYTTSGFNSYVIFEFFGVLFLFESAT